MGEHIVNEGGADDEGVVVRLRLLETADLHMVLRGWNYYRACEEPGEGLTRLATLIREARAEVPNCLLFDDGDTYQGTPLGDFAAQQVQAGGPHPMVRAMNALGYDAATLGNHEFNYGLPVLRRILEEVRFPVVCGNLTLEDGGGAFLPPYVVLERKVRDEAGDSHLLKIGVIGFLPPQIMQWDAVHTAGLLRVEDMVEAARRLVPDLRARCDLLVALCHSGISSGERAGRDENAARYLAEEAGIDVLMLGHTHHVFPGAGHENIPGVDGRAGTIGGKPAVMPGSRGTHLGVVDLRLRKVANGWRRDWFHVEVRAVARQGVAVAEDPELVAVVAPEHDATVAWMNEIVAASGRPLCNWFTFLGPDPCLSLVNRAQLAFARTALEGTQWADLPLLSAASPFRADHRKTKNFVEIPAGSLTMRDMASIYPFANTVSIVCCRGAEIRNWLERAASVFNRLGRAEGHAGSGARPLVDPRAPVYVFDVLQGDGRTGLLTYTIDLREPARYCENGGLAAPDARRIRDVRLDGRPLRDEDRFVVVTNNYRACGGGKFPGTGLDHVIMTTQRRNRDVVIDYVRKHGVPDDLLAPGWSFAPIPADERLTIDLPRTAGEAAGRRADLRLMGMTEQGNLRYRVAPVRMESPAVVQ